jgi:hypothetical protein
MNGSPDRFERSTYLAAVGVWRGSAAVVFSLGQFEGFHFHLDWLELLTVFVSHRLSRLCWPWCERKMVDGGIRTRREQLDASS